MDIEQIAQVGQNYSFLKETGLVLGALLASIPAFYFANLAYRIAICNPHEYDANRLALQRRKKVELSPKSFVYVAGTKDDETRLNSRGGLNQISIDSVLLGKD